MHGTLSLRDARRQTYYDGAKVGMAELDKVPAKVHKAKDPSVAMSNELLSRSAPCQRKYVSCAASSASAIDPSMRYARAIYS